MQRGFTLFEILLSLVVMSMIVVAGMEWSNRKHEESAAAQLGHRLFQYGLAVTEYARQNPDAYTVDYPPPEAMYGITWLQDPAKPNREMCRDPNDLSTCETFLGSDFTFEIDSLMLMPLVEGDETSYVRVIFEPPTSRTPGPLRVELVEVGKVYRYNKKKREYDVDVSLDSRAINFANHFTDQNGSPQIFYGLYPIDIDGMITGKPFTHSANVDSGYLRTDGSNEMDASLHFSQTANQRDIEGVGALEFANASKSTFSGITMQTPADTPSLTCNLNNNQCKLIPVTKDSRGKTTNVCFLSQAKHRQPENYQGGEYFGCEIFTQNNYWVIKNQNVGGDRNRSTCSAICLSWGS